MAVKRVLGSLRDLIIVIVTPLLFMPLILAIDGPEAPCAYVIIVMAIYWVTEALPINVTGLLPVFLFPMFGVMNSKDVACSFFKSTTLLFLGSFMVASAIEKWNIHKRIALRILLTLGSKPAWLMLGLMLSSWFLSIWISNMSTTAMMLPIATAIVDELREVELLAKRKGGEEQIANDGKEVQIALDDLTTTAEQVCNQEIEVTVLSNGEKPETFDEANGVVVVSGQGVRTVHPLRFKHWRNGEKPEKFDEANGVVVANGVGHKKATTEARWRYLAKAFALCICYASNIGGIGGPTGTLPNVILYGQIGGVYERLGKENPITFANWLLFGIPTSLTINIAAWLWLQFYFLRCRGVFKCCYNEEDDEGTRVHEILKKQYQRLGKFSFAQMAVTGHFVGLIVLWISMDLGGDYGWSKAFKDSYIKGAVPAMLVGVSLFIFPSSFAPLFSKEKSERKKIRPLMLWNDFSDKMPWGVIFLFGGGFTIAAGARDSGLSVWIGNNLKLLSHLHPTVLLLCLCFIVAAATELTTNAATASLILPIIADLSAAIGMEPVYLMLPVTVASSFAFMLPVANPPNAFVFSSGVVTIVEMAKAGFMLNIIGTLILIAFMETLGRALYL